jgi:hypothetical protein
MGFIQIIDATTSNYDELAKLEKEWEAATEGARTTTRRILARDRDNPNHYLNIVFFDSYESAMANSDLPATSEFAQRMAGLLDGPPTFINLDVVDDRA